MFSQYSEVGFKKKVVRIIKGETGKLRESPSKQFSLCTSSESIIIVTCLFRGNQVADMSEIDKLKCLSMLRALSLTGIETDYTVLCVC